MSSVEGGTSRPLQSPHQRLGAWASNWTPPGPQRPNASPPAARARAVSPPRHHAVSGRASSDRAGRRARARDGGPARRPSHAGSTATGPPAAASSSTSEASAGRRGQPAAPRPRGRPRRWRRRLVPRLPTWPRAAGPRESGTRGSRTACGPRPGPTRRCRSGLEVDVDRTSAPAAWPRRWRGPGPRLGQALAAASGVSSSMWANIAVEVAVGVDQLGRGLLSHPGHAGQVVGGVAPQGGVLRDSGPA